MSTQIPNDWQYSNPTEAHEVGTYFATTPTAGFVLADSQANANKIINFIRNLGDGTYYNGKTMEYAIRSLAKELEWNDVRRKLKSGEVALDASADSLTVKMASAAQLKDLLKQHTKSNAYDGEQNLKSWDIPLKSVAEGGTLTKSQFIHASAIALKSWMLRRKNAGLGTAFVE